jgi:hypothetical protein
MLRGLIPRRNPRPSLIQPHRSSLIVKVDTISAPRPLFRCGGSGVTFRKAHPPAQIAGRVGQPSVGRCDKDGPVGPPVIPTRAKIPPSTALFGSPHPSTPAQGRLSRAKNAREMGHPGLSTASWGHAVVRSLGALSALLRMTRMGRVSMGRERGLVRLRLELGAQTCLVGGRKQVPRRVLAASRLRDGSE